MHQIKDDSRLVLIEKRVRYSLQNKMVEEAFLYVGIFESFVFFIRNF